MTSEPASGDPRRTDGVWAARIRPHLAGRDQHYAESEVRRRRALNVTAWIAAAVSALFAVVQVATGSPLWQLLLFNLGLATTMLAIPLLHRFGELVAPLTFVVAAYFAVFAVCWYVGTDSGVQVYLVVAATIAVLILGVDRVRLAVLVAAVGAALAIVLQVLVPGDRGVQPVATMVFNYVVSTVSACLLVFATLYYALRETDRAEKAMEREYQRSEALLANILPSSIAARLKEPEHDVVADRFDDASVLFADIVGFTERAALTSPVELVGFLNALYARFDSLAGRRGLEKIKTTGDSYMVVGGVPERRPDHLAAIAELALEMRDAAAHMSGSAGPVPMRIGIGAGPVVAGVVGTHRFFYDVWGDAVNVASRMESTGATGLIQVPAAVYERLRDRFVFAERGDVAVKGKGTMRTWLLVAPRPSAAP